MRMRERKGGEGEGNMRVGGQVTSGSSDRSIIPVEEKQCVFKGL